MLRYFLISLCFLKLTEAGSDCAPISLGNWKDPDKTIGLVSDIKYCENKEGGDSTTWSADYVADDDKFTLLSNYECQNQVSFKDAAKNFEHTGKYYHQGIAIWYEGDKIDVLQEKNSLLTHNGNKFHFCVTHDENRLGCLKVNAHQTKEPKDMLFYVVSPGVTKDDRFKKSNVLCLIPVGKRTDQVTTLTVDTYDPLVFSDTSASKLKIDSKAIKDCYSSIMELTPEEVPRVFMTALKHVWYNDKDTPDDGKAFYTEINKMIYFFVAPGDSNDKIPLDSFSQSDIKSVAQTLGAITDKLVFPDCRQIDFIINQVEVIGEIKKEKRKQKMKVWNAFKSIAKAAGNVNTISGPSVDIAMEAISTLININNKQTERHEQVMKAFLEFLKAIYELSKSSIREEKDKTDAAQALADKVNAKIMKSAGKEARWNKLETNVDIILKKMKFRQIDSDKFNTKKGKEECTESMKRFTKTIQVAFGDIEVNGKIRKQDWYDKLIMTCAPKSSLWMSSNFRYLMSMKTIRSIYPGLPELEAIEPVDALDISSQIGDLRDGINQQVTIGQIAPPS